MKIAILSAAIAISAILTGCSIYPLGLAASTALPPRPQVLLFVAQPSVVDNGSTVTLQWVVTGADRITIDNGVGVVGDRGSAQVKPDKITAYNLTATNTGGRIGYAVIVNVRPAVKVASQSGSVTVVTPPGTVDNHPDFPTNLLPKLSADESYVFVKGGVMVGADNHYIVLRDNPSARDPSWTELKTFLLADQTDKHPYISGKFTCGDFAEMLHNNAEAAGIKAALVAIELRSDNGAEQINHSLNAFDTTDRGMVYIDDTSSTQGFTADKIANLKVGQEYTSTPIFPPSGETIIWPPMGIVTAIDVFQW